MTKNSMFLHELMVFFLYLQSKSRNAHYIKMYYNMIGKQLGYLAYGSTYILYNKLCLFNSYPLVPIKALENREHNLENRI